MVDQKLKKEILKKALKNEEEITLNEVIKGTSFKYLGATNIDLYIFTNKKFIEKIIINNLLKIKKLVSKIDKKTIRDVYLNNKKQEFNLKELNSKNTIDMIDISSIKNRKNYETSGESDIVSETFKYESSILNKKKITLVFYNKFLNKEYIETISTNVINNLLKFYKKKKIIKKIKYLIEFKYKPNTNDTKEFLNLLDLN